MKLKKFSSKLALNKSTVANLGTRELSAVFGGGRYSDDDFSCADPCNTDDTLFDCPGMVTHEPGCPESVNPIYCDLSASSI